MGEQARKLLKALAVKGACSASETGMTQADLKRAVDDLGRMVDDDNHAVTIVHATRRGDEITALELTPSGRGLAQHS